MGAGNKIGATVARLAAGDEPLPADGTQLGVLQGASPGRGGCLEPPCSPRGAALLSAVLGGSALPSSSSQALLFLAFASGLLLCGCFLPLRSTEPRVEGEAVLGVNPPAPGRRYRH